MQKSDADLLKEEQVMFGYHHVETGVYMSRRLNFPETLTRIIGVHHRPIQSLDEDDRKRMAAVVNAANKAANALGCAINHQVDWDDCSQDPIWEYMLEAQILGYESKDALLDMVYQEREAMIGYVETIS
jgi:hypothetical protein